MRDKLAALVLLVSLISCSEEELPVGLYHYQVERLLSGTGGTKTWLQANNSTNCVDSVKLVFALVENSSNDSLDISMISGCTSTASFLGRASASKAVDRDLFTDSLIFASGDFWIINQVTSQQLMMGIDGADYQYIGD